MEFILELWNRLREFTVAGGPVLWLIMVVTFWMWSLIIERFCYFWLAFPRVKCRAMDLWQDTLERVSEHNGNQQWIVDRSRQRIVSIVNLGLQKHIRFIIALVAICPLLGLFGTVLGMLEVFEVMSFLGGHNVRSMASGVSKATLTTMAGMVAALPGVIFATYLKREVRRQTQRLNDALKTTS